MWVPSREKAIKDDKDGERRESIFRERPRANQSRESRLPGRNCSQDAPISKESFKRRKEDGGKKGAEASDGQWEKNQGRVKVLSQG